MSPIEVLETDILRLTDLPPEDNWRQIRPRLTVASFPGGGVIMSQARVADHWLFLTAGIAASEQSTDDGGSSIARFFEKTQFCANLTSAWQREICSDDLIAITDVEGVLVPDRIFREEYLRGGPFGEYLRLKLMETLLFDKTIICAKTSGNTEIRYRFLEENHDEVVRYVPQKVIARFVGITPQGLSRFLRHRRDAVS